MFSSMNEYGYPTTQQEAIIYSHVEVGSKVFTDAWKSYRGLSPYYNHLFVDHAVAYVQGNVSTNGIENFWSLLKRSVKGTYVQVTPAHLFRYLDEQMYRYNERKTTMPTVLSKRCAL